MTSHAPEPDEPPAAKPERVRMDLKSWLYTITATIQRFLRNQGTDMAAALTYYTVLTIFPALLCIVSLMKLSGIGDVLVPKLTGLISQASSDEFLTDTLVGLIAGWLSPFDPLHRDHPAGRRGGAGDVRADHPPPHETQHPWC